VLIILEGPDGGGKTTLAEALYEFLDERDHARGVVRMHKGPPVGHPLDEYLRPISAYRPGRSPHLILDRWHWGERVYPALRGRVSQLDDAAWWAIESLLARLGALVVYVYGDLATYRRVYAERGEDVDALLEELPLVDKAYRDVRLRSFQLQQFYQWSSPLNSEVERVVKLAHVRESTVVDLVTTTYSGPRHPEFLLFGDVRHELRHVDPSSREARANTDPAFLPFPGTSGHFLRGALADAGTTIRYGLANACDVDDPRRLWDSLGRPRTVALGRNAQRRLAQLAVPHGVVPHPQYVRRFHHLKRGEYGNLIALALTKQEDLGTWPDSSTVATVATSTPRSSRTSAAVASAARPATD
jgi:hypothetical protein